MSRINNPPLTSVIIPIHDGEAIISRTFRSLFKQVGVFYEVIVIDDGSTDKSAKLILELKKKWRTGKRKFLVITHEIPQGLGATYNQAILKCKSKFVVTMSQDIYLKTELTLAQLLEPIINNESVVASYHSADIPYRLWQTYGFWQKVFFSRGAGIKSSGLNGKFDCFRKSALLRVGLFDDETFRTAGEDGDIERKLLKVGKVVTSNAEVVHIHGIDPNFNYLKVIRKHAQYAEAQGALLKRYGIGSLKTFAVTFFREILALCLLVPFVQVVGIFLVIFYAFLYTKNVYLTSYANPRILVLPLINIFLLYVSLVFSLRGYITGKQRL